MQQRTETIILNDISETMRSQAESLKAICDETRFSAANRLVIEDIILGLALTADKLRRYAQQYR